MIAGTDAIRLQPSTGPLTLPLVTGPLTLLSRLLPPGKVLGLRAE